MNELILDLLLGLSASSQPSSPPLTYMASARLAQIGLRFNCLLPSLSLGLLRRKVGVLRFLLVAFFVILFAASGRCWCLNR